MSTKKFKGLLGLKAEDETTVHFFVLYHDVIGADLSRTVTVPVLEETFYSVDPLNALWEAFREIADYFTKEAGYLYSVRCEHGEERHFITTAWQKETRAFWTPTGAEAHVPRRESNWKGVGR